MGNYMYQLQRRWAYRRHNKGGRWLHDKYYNITEQSPGGWHFSTCKEGKVDKKVNLHRSFAVKYIPGHATNSRVERTTAVESNIETMAKIDQPWFGQRVKTSKYDGNDLFWAKRTGEGYGKIKPSHAKMLRKQGGMCTYCKKTFQCDDMWEAHHITHRTKGGSDTYTNLAL
jgi:5-methylcytosine-specific restriction endonuclease McrA